MAVSFFSTMVSSPTFLLCERVMQLLLGCVGGGGDGVGGCGRR